MSERAPATAIVASRNEAALLGRCLRGLAFCDEIIVIDLESTDETDSVAVAHGARVVQHPLVPIAELAKVHVAPSARNDWLVLVDPDEEVPPALAAEAVELLSVAPPDLGVAYAPIAYMFRERPLRGTTWGGQAARPFLVRRSAVVLSEEVHRTFALKDGYTSQHLRRSTETLISHRWCTGYRDWLEKHIRYLQLEGATRANDGFVTGYKGIARTPWRAFRFSFLERRGYLDGFRGFALSVLWALYSTAAEIALFRELHRRAAASAGL